MKKGLLIFLMAALFGAAFGQRIIVDSIRINTANIVAADTIIPFPQEHVMTDYSITWDFTGVNADDAQISVMIANKRGGWKELVNSLFPYTLNKTAKFDTLTNKANDGCYGESLFYPFVAIRYKKGSVTSGYIDIKRVFLMPLDRNYIKY